MILPLRPLRNPLSELDDLPVRQSRGARIRGGHAPGQVHRSHAPDEFAPGDIPGDNGEMPPKVTFGPRFGIQPQLACALALIRAVTGVALIGENRPDFAVEIDTCA